MTEQDNWIAILGQMEFRDDEIIFKGNKEEPKEQQLGLPTTIYQVGNFISNYSFGNGSVSVIINFDSVHEFVSAGIILYFDPQTNEMVTVKLGGLSLLSIQTFVGEYVKRGYKWNVIASAGDPEQLVAGKNYKLDVNVNGSEVKATLNNVNAIDTRLPAPLPLGQVGLWAMGDYDIKFSSFNVETLKPKLFVVMPFTEKFNELYENVILPKGEENGFNVIRADEIKGPGIIINDIEQQIIESKAIIAEITSTNPNVFWEIGYAHAIRKPTILIAEHQTQLPFDVSPFRTLFYENTIGGKSELEINLVKHLQAIQSQ